MGGDEDRRTGSLVDLAGLDADEPVLHHVEPADALGSTTAVQFLDGLQDGDLPTVDGDRDTVLEGDDEFVGRVAHRRILGVGVEILRRRVPEILEEAGLDGTAPDVLVDGERRLGGLFDREVDLLGEGDRLVPGPGEVPCGGDDLQVGVHVGEADLETDLVVALTGAAVGDVGSAVLLGGLDEVLDDQRAGDRGDQRVLLHVHAVGLDGRQAVLLGELVLGVDDDRLHGAAVEGTLTHALHVLAALAEVECHGHDLTAGHLGQVRDGHRGVEAA